MPIARRLRAEGTCLSVLDAVAMLSLPPGQKHLAEEEEGASGRRTFYGATGKQETWLFQGTSEKEL